ncbi:MAG TPA: N-formylglutamate amidohydrolase [Alphaproteobacteria bacterium]|nr:N-formylglutamate amidohydrolase [Alphaproteobacteria bacterium]
MTAFPATVLAKAPALQAACPSLLGPNDPPPFRAVNPTGRAPALLLADHAGRAFPESLGRLGLGEAPLDLHIAYDIGVEWMTRRLAELLDAPALIHAYSRLLLDPNRTLDDPTSICAISDGVVVPGNRQLTDAEAEARAEAFFHPYHDAIEAAIEGFADRGVSPAIISMHSFTPMMRGFERPWEVGILWGEDGRMPLPLMEALRGDGVVVGDNEPYSGRNMHGYTIETHALARALPNVLIEVRQDLIGTKAEAEAWAERLAPPLAALLEDPELTRAAQT